MLPKITAEDVFIYSAFVFSLKAGASHRQDILVHADSDFEWHWSSCAAVMDGEDDVSSALPIAVQIGDGGSGRYLFDKPVVLGAFCKKRLPKPRVFLSRTTITIEFISLTQRDVEQLNFVMFGKKIFRLCA